MLTRYCRRNWILPKFIFPQVTSFIQSISYCKAQNGYASEVAEFYPEKKCMKQELHQDIAFMYVN